MRKPIVVTAIIILALQLTGCGNGKIPSIPISAVPTATKPAGNDANQQPNTKDSEAKSTDSSTPIQSDAGTEIVAKSENTMSNSDKEELLNQVDKELDALFNNINNLDDAQDADLDLNQK